MLKRAMAVQIESSSYEYYTTNCWRWTESSCTLPNNYIIKILGHIWKSFYYLFLVA